MRPFVLLFLYIVIAICGVNTIGLKIFSILFLMISVVVFYIVCRKISDNIIFSCIAAILFASSRLTFYNLLEIWGIGESISISLILFIIYILFYYLKKREVRFVVLLPIVLFLLLASHERYFVLLLPVLLSLLFINARWSRKIIDIGIILATFALFVVIKVVVFKCDFIPGTEDNPVLINFDLIFSNFSKIFLNVFQFPLVDTYLFGLTFADSPAIFKFLSVVSFIAMLIFSIIFLFILFKTLSNKEKRLKNKLLLKELLSVFLFAFILFASLLVVKRIESRFLLLLFALLLLCFAFTINKSVFVFNSSKNKTHYSNKITAAGFAVASIFIFATNIFAQFNSHNIYLVNDWIEKGNLLYHNVYEPYKTEYQNKTLVLFLENEKDAYAKDYMLQFNLKFGYSFHDYSDRFNYLYQISDEQYNFSVLISIAQNYEISRLYR